MATVVLGQDAWNQKGGHVWRMQGAMDIYYVDGEFVSADRAVIPVDDLAVLRGLGAFELLRTYSGHPFALAEHLRALAAFG